MVRSELVRVILSRLKTLSIILFIAVIMLAALEILLSVVDIKTAFLESKRGDRKIQADCFQDKEAARAYFREFHQSKNMRWEPYSYWRRKAFSGSFIMIDDHGIRRTYNAAHNAKPVNIFVFGGSVLWGTGARDAYTIPSYISKILGKKGYDVQVTNFGESGYVSTQEMVVLLRELQNGNVPDIAVFYDGVNDLFSALQNKKAGIPQNEEKRERYFALERGMEGSGADGLFSAFVQRSHIMRFVQKLRRKLHKGTNTSVSEEMKARLARDTVRIYQGNMKIIESLGRAYGFKVLFYWQPVIFTKKQLSEYEKKEAGQADKKGSKKGFLGDFSQMYEMTSRHIRDAKPTSETIAVHDMSSVFDDLEGPLYLDFCHTCEEANEIVAKRISGDIAHLLKSGKVRLDE